MKRKNAKLLAMGMMVVTGIVVSIAINSTSGQRSKVLADKDFAQFCQTQANGDANNFDFCKRELATKLDECAAQHKYLAQPCVKIVMDAYKAQYNGGQ